MVVHGEAERAVDEARAMFRRTLSGWAMDVMELRRRGLNRPLMPRREGQGDSGRAVSSSDNQPAHGGRS